MYTIKFHDNCTRSIYRDSKKTVFHLSIVSENDVKKNLRVRVEPMTAAAAVLCTANEPLFTRSLESLQQIL